MWNKRWKQHVIRTKSHPMFINISPFLSIKFILRMNSVTITELNLNEMRWKKKRSSEHNIMEIWERSDSKDAIRRSSSTTTTTTTTSEAAAQIINWKIERKSLSFWIYDAPTDQLTQVPCVQRAQTYIYCGWRRDDVQLKRYIYSIYSEEWPSYFNFLRELRS